MSEPGAPSSLDCTGRGTHASRESRTHRASDGGHCIARRYRRYACADRFVLRLVPSLRPVSAFPAAMAGRRSGLPRRDSTSWPRPALNHARPRLPFVAGGEPPRQPVERVRFPGLLTRTSRGPLFVPNLEFCVLAAGADRSVCLLTRSR